MINNRSRETSKLIDILAAAAPGQEFTKIMLAEALGLPNQGIGGYLTAARRYVQKHHGIVFASIRGVGIRRMAGDEIAEDQRRGISHVRRTARKYNNRRSCITDHGALSAASKAAISVLAPIFTKLADDTAAGKIRTQIEIARIDTAANIVNILTAAGPAN